MGLESATRIDQLVATNPVGATDPRSQGDDHLRLIKTALQGTFPAFTGAITATHVQVNYSADLTGVTGSGAMVRNVAPTLTGIATVGTINAAAGTVGAPSLSFAGDPDTGLYNRAANTLSAVAAGVLTTDVDSQGFRILNGVVRQDNDGTASAPAYTFTSDPNTGIMRTGTDTGALVGGGTASLYFDPNSVYVLDGSAAAPSIRFLNDTDTGLFRSTSNRIGVALNGTDHFLFYQSGLQLQQSGMGFYASDGSVSLPSHSFANDSDTGMYLPGANDLAIVAGGQLIIDCTPSSILLNKQVEFAANVSTLVPAGAASALPATPQGYLAVTINGTQRRIPFYPN